MSYRVAAVASSRYAPLRYEATRPFAVRLGAQFQGRAALGARERGRYLQKDLLPAIRQELNRLGTQNGPGPGQAEIANVQVFGSYFAGGRVIYDFHKKLTSALLDTDVDSIPLSVIPRPANALYLHFGNESGLSEAGDTIEGAFVAWSDYAGESPRMMIDFVKKGQFSDSLFWLLESGEPTTGCSIDISSPEKGIIEALEDSVAGIEAMNKSVLAQMAETVRQLKEQFGEVASIPSPVSRLGQNMPLLRRGLALVVNCLLYLGVAPEDREDDWDDRADPALAELAKNADKPGTRKTAERTLVNKGYLKVRFVGHGFAASSAGQAFGDTGRVVSTHFRRGHFRNQPYGPERSLRKVIFIPPVVVNPGQGEPAGRIYEV